MATGRTRRSRRFTEVVHGLLLLAAIATALLTRHIEQWDMWPLLVIAVFTVGSEMLGVQTAVDGAGRSGASIGIILAAVLYGDGPAAALGVLVASAGWWHSREVGEKFRRNLLTLTWFPLLTALAFHALTKVTGSGRGDVGFYLLAFVASLMAVAINATMVALGRERRPLALARRVGAMVGPVLSAELFSAGLTVGAVFVTVKLHLAGLAMLAAALAIVQYLLAELFTSQRRSEQLRRIATTDELTGLANRERFRQVVEERISSARLGATRFAVLLMDLDRFKEVNDTLGHVYGDRLLCDLGPRLVEAIGTKGLVARLGGDEFGILLGEDADDLPVVEGAVARLLSTVAEPFAVDELSLEVGASVGVARFPEDGEDAHALLRCADIAMYVAKEAQTDYKFYSADQNQHSVRRLSVLSDIRHALTSDEIVVHYQPIVDLEDLTVKGAEGLVRWEHPEHGLVPPGAFVQTVEQSGLIGPLTRHVLENAIAQCAAWRRDGHDMSVAVNLSVRNLLDRDLPREIERMLDSYGVPADALQLEITESMIMSDPDRALATVSRISALGIRLSVDDFGTGYSSLANLRRLPIDELKIDRSFVSPMLQDESDLIIVRSTINLGHDLGLKIIAEGVEDRETLDHLAELGCDLAQGYHLSRPMAAHAFNRWLTEWPRSDEARTPTPDVAPGPAVAPVPAGGWSTTGSGLLVAASEA